MFYYMHNKNNLLRICSRHYVCMYVCMYFLIYLSIYRMLWNVCMLNYLQWIALTHTLCLRWREGLFIRHRRDAAVHGTIRAHRQPPRQGLGVDYRKRTGRRSPRNYFQTPHHHSYCGLPTTTNSYDRFTMGPMNDTIITCIPISAIAIPHT